MSEGEEQGDTEDDRPLLARLDELEDRPRRDDDRRPAEKNVILRPILSEKRPKTGIMMMFNTEPIITAVSPY